MADRNLKLYRKIQRVHCAKLDLLDEKVRELQGRKGRKPLQEKFHQVTHVYNYRKLSVNSAIPKTHLLVHKQLTNECSRAATSKQDVVTLFRKVREHTSSASRIEKYILSHRFLSKVENSILFDKSTELQLIKDNLKITTYINKLRRLRSSKYDILK